MDTTKLKVRNFLELVLILGDCFANFHASTPFLPSSSVTALSPAPPTKVPNFMYC